VGLKAKATQQLLVTLCSTAQTHVKFKGQKDQNPSNSNYFKRKPQIKSAEHEKVPHHPDQLEKLSNSILVSQAIRGIRGDFQSIKPENHDKNAPKTA